MAEVSVIIPTENSADNLDALLLSIFTQSEQDTEIILVDNVSDDETLHLLERYRQFDKRVQVIKLKEKTSLTECCRIGMKKATAPYVYFMNGTKYVYLAQGCLARLLLNIRTFDSDFVYSTCLVVDAVNWTPLPFYQIKPENFVGKNVFNAGDIAADLLFRLYLTPWGKLYKKEFLEEMNFAPYEESFFLECLLRAKKITYDLANLYIYHMQPYGLVRKNVTAEEDMNAELLHKYGVFEKYKTAYIYHKMRCLWLNVMFAPTEEQRRLFEEMKAAFADEDFSEYDMHMLGKEDLYMAIVNTKRIGFEEFSKLYLGRAA